MPSPFLAFAVAVALVESKIPASTSTNVESLQGIRPFPGALPGYIHVADVGARRPAPQERLQALPGLLVAVRHDLDGVGRAVAHRAGHTQRASRLQRGGATTDPLPSAMNDGEEALHGRARRR